MKDESDAVAAECVALSCRWSRMPHVVNPRLELVVTRLDDARAPRVEEDGICPRGHVFPGKSAVAADEEADAQQLSVEDDEDEVALRGDELHDEHEKDSHLGLERASAMSEIGSTRRVGRRDGRSKGPERFKGQFENNLSFQGRGRDLSCYESGCAKQTKHPNSDSQRG